MRRSLPKLLRRACSRSGLLILLCLGTPSAFAPAAHAGSADASAIRAAMLLNIARFVNWPAWKLDSSHPQFQVCILGDGPLGAYANQYLQHQTIDNRPVLVRHLGAGDEIEPCHVLYMEDDDPRRAKRLGADVGKAAVLTVSEQPNSGHPDQMIGLPIVNERVHIDVNLGTAQRAGLEISSRLLRLATVTQ